ncbi:NTP transferase domain-containing protein [Ancylobacter sp. IITR112]|uniref:NTP transferase domain-containing protein n=1 Tax=Ancylobacter sp. IITR112 TaxID=3138073 RepID=UPI00352B1876
MTPEPGGADVVILAAGRGRRMGLDAHKALVPVLAGKGTLERLLMQLAGLPAGAVTVVTGYRSDEVAASVRAFLPRARCVHNPAFATTELLQSLACAFTRAPPTRDCWVLLADTLYSDAALAALFAAPPGGLALAVTARTPDDAGAIAVTVRDGAVVALAEAAASSAWCMAHAVRWPPMLQARACAAAAAGLRFQWQAIAALQREPTTAAFPIRAIMLPLGGARDLDTQADLEQARSLVSP